jgi:2-polyprenyl-3-methyl-5-hydroxy-6-metoxy-1,4-benzoquinol methylase
MYRVPTDDLSANFRFYQDAYEQGFTTEMPNDEDLDQLLQKGFEGTEKCYRYYISVLRHLGLRGGARIFDYGCSWGYGSWQLSKAGYQITAYEISKSRANFAKSKLGIECIPDVTECTFQVNLQGAFDCFFSAHVLEHVPSPAHVVELAKLALRPGGYFVAFTPNGSEAFRRADPKAWHMFWGKVHPNLLDDEFYRHTFAAQRLHLDTSPINLDALSRFADGDKVTTSDLSKSELLCVAKL